LLLNLIGSLREMNKNEARTILAANLKGRKKKRSSLLTIAEAARLLISDKEYGSVSILAKSFGVSRSTIESFDRIIDQPEEIKKLIQEDQIRIDACTKLSSIIDLKKRVDLAKTVAGLTAEETRRTIDYCKKHPELSPEDCKKAVINSKPAKKQVKSVTIHLKSEDYAAFTAASERAGLHPEEAGKQAISEWIKKLG
jgi:hypothetical protein